MSNGAPNHGSSAVQTERGVFLGETRFVKTLASYIRHGYANGNLEANNYASISYLLSVHGMACQHPDPTAVVAITPQSPFEATFGTTTRRRSPDWSKTLIFDQDFICGDPAYRQPRLGALWEDKKIEGYRRFTAKSRKKVLAQAMQDVSTDLKQLREQALCAFLKFPDDKFFAFLSYRDCWYLFEFERPSDLDLLRSKYKALFEAAEKVKKEQKSSASAPTFDDVDLPIPGVHFAGEDLLANNSTELSKPLLIALSRVRARLGLSVDQSSPFWISPDAAEDFPQTNPRMTRVQSIINELKEQQNETRLPSDEVENPQQGTAEPQGEAPEPQEGPAEPQQEAVEPLEEAAEVAVELQQGTVEPQQGVTEPQEGTAEPEETSSASESESESESTSQDSHSSDDDYQSGSPSLSSSTGSNDSAVPDSLLGDLSVDALSNEAETTEPRGQDHHQETVDRVLDGLADPPASSDDGTEIIQVTTVLPPRRSRAHSAVTHEDPLVTEPLPGSDATVISKATVRRSTRSRKNMPASSGGRADVSEASNVAIETENAVAASSQRRVQPQAVAAVNQKENNNSNVDVGDRTGTTGLPRRDTEVVGDLEADDGRPRVRSSARLAAQSKGKRGNSAARSVTQKSSLPKPRGAASGSDTETRPAPPAGKKRKVPAGGNARVTAATGRSTLAGPSNAQTPAARGRTGAPRGRGANRKKKDQDA